MFAITGDFEHTTSCGCVDCSPVQAALWTVRGVLFETDPEFVLRAMASDGYAKTHADDPFIALELILAGVLANAYSLAARDAELVLKPAFEPPYNRRDIDEALAKAQVILGKAFDNSTRIQVEQLVDKLLTNGALDAVEAARPENDPTPAAIDELQAGDRKDVSVLPALVGAGAVAGLLDNAGTDATTGTTVAAGTILENRPDVEAILQGIMDSADYYTNGHFNEVILPEIQQRILDMINSTDPMAEADPTDIFEYISERLRSVPYWRVVANAAASRAYHYGYMKAGELAGVEGYSIVAVIDGRTSDICLEMDGKVFMLSDATQLMERVSTNVKDLTEKLMPWRKFTEIQGANEEALGELGCLVPPFHGNCRSTVKFIYSAPEIAQDTLALTGAEALLGE